MIQKRFNFFQDHSLKYLEMALRTDRQAKIAMPDGYGNRTGDCGDTVEFFLSVRDDVIEDISFLVHGCMNTNACCNAVVEMACDMRVEDAWDITPEYVIRYLETLPSYHFHCAELTVGTFYLALSNYQDLRRSPWKKTYQGTGG